MLSISPRAELFQDHMCSVMKRPHSSNLHPTREIRSSQRKSVKKQNFRACARCRQYKTRCDRTKDSKSPCKQCKKKGAECLPQQPPRPRTRTHNFVVLIPPRSTSQAIKRPEDEQKLESLEPQLDDKAYMGDLWPNDNKAKRLIAQYRESYFKYLPFVTVPDCPSRQIWMSDPWLWKAIIITTDFKATRDIRQKRAEDLIQQLRRGRKTINKPEVHKKLHKAVLICVSWRHRFLNGDSGQLPNALKGLATSVFLYCWVAWMGKGKVHADSDDCRLLLGTFYLSSLYLSFIDAIRPSLFSEIVQYALKKLNDQESILTDHSLLVPLVEHQRLVESARYMAKDLNPTCSEDYTLIMQDHQSHKLWNALSNEDSRIPGLHLPVDQFHRSQLYLDGAGIHQKLWESRHAYPGQHRMLVVSRCLEGVRGLFEWLSICSSNTFFNVPCLLWDQLTYGIKFVELFRLEATQREQTSLLVVMDIISARLEKVKSLRSKWASRSDKDDMIDKVTSKLDRVREAYSS